MSLDAQVNLLLVGSPDAPIRVVGVAVEVSAFDASVANPRGLTDIGGLYTTVVTPTSADPSCTVRACVATRLADGIQRASVLCGVQTIKAPSSNGAEVELALVEARAYGNRVVDSADLVALGTDRSTQAATVALQNASATGTASHVLDGARAEEGLLKGVTGGTADFSATCARNASIFEQRDGSQQRVEQPTSAGSSVLGIRVPAGKTARFAATVSGQGSGNIGGTDTQASVGFQLPDPSVSTPPQQSFITYSFRTGGTANPVSPQLYTADMPGGTTWFVTLVASAACGLSQSSTVAGHMTYTLTALD